MMDNRLNILTLIACAVFSCSAFCQTTDTTTANGSDTSAIAQPTPTKKLPPPPPPPTSDTGITDLGVAVAPSNIRYRTRPGSITTKQITVTNDTHKPEKFKISVSNYDMNDKGAVRQLPIGEDFEYGLAKHISITPSFIELAPGEAKKIDVTLDLPDEPDSYKAGWCLIMIDQTTEKKFIVPENKGGESVVMGIIPVFGFGVYVFQNPPNVTLNKVVINKFFFNYDNKDRYIAVQAKNTGTGLGFCKLYVEINNLNTGYKEKLFVKQFTIFPGKERLLDYQIPGNIEKGNYIATAILDFGSREEVEAAELEFKVE